MALDYDRLHDGARLQRKMWERQMPIPKPRGVIWAYHFKMECLDTALRRRRRGNYER